MPVLDLKTFLKLGVATILKGMARIELYTLCSQKLCTRS